VTTNNDAGAMAVTPSSSGPSPPADVRRLRHPLEKRVATLVSVVDMLLATVIVAALFWGTEWLESRPMLAKYEIHAKILVALIAGAPLLATFARHRWWLLVQQESIRVSRTQLPEVHAVLLRHCRRLDIAPPDLYLSDSVDHTTSFSWGDHHCIILSTHDFIPFPDEFDDLVDWLLAREVGAICLGHTSYRNELVRTSVAPIPFLCAPLNRVQTYSCDRFGAFLAPRSFRALIVTASGDRLCERVDADAFFRQLDEDRDSGLVAAVIWLFKRRVPLAHRIGELRRAGLLPAA
jgi:hypothetical protein